MNEIDTMIRGMMLAYPSLFPTRFEAFSDLMTNSAYEWQNGKLVDIFPTKNVTPEEMISRAEQQLLDEKYEQMTNKVESQNALYRRFVVEAERKYFNITHIANNIEVYASDYTMCDHNELQVWLFNKHRHGINGNWSINQKPDDIDPEWRAAIHEWVMVLMPTANGMMMDYNGKPIQEYAKIHNWLTDKLKEYAPNF